MKRKLGLLLAIFLLTQLFAGDTIKPEHLTLDTFQTKIFDYEHETQWNFLGDQPAIIDFYADWCGPCKRVAPIMEELAVDYDGRVKIYKIDTEDQRQLAGMFGITSIPSILFIPLEGQPQMIMGAFPKENYLKQIEDILKIK